MIPDKKYKLKIAAARVTVRLVEVLSSIDATDLSGSKGKKQIDRHDVAECILETTRPVAFDPITDIQATGRFVIVDNYDIAGGGIITGNITDKKSVLEEHINRRERRWDTGLVTPSDRHRIYGHKAKFIVITCGNKSSDIAKQLELRLVNLKNVAYYLGPSSLVEGLGSDVVDAHDQREEQIRRLGELARILTDAGILFITALSDADQYDLRLLARLTAPNEFLHVFFSGSFERGAQNEIQLDDELSQTDVLNHVLTRLTQRDIISDYVI